MEFTPPPFVPPSPPPQPEPVKPEPPANPFLAYGDRAFAMDPTVEPTQSSPPPPPTPSFEKPALEGRPFSLDTPFLNANEAVRVPDPPPSAFEEPLEIIQKDLPSTWDVDEVVKSAPVPPPDRPLGSVPPLDLSAPVPVPELPQDQQTPIPIPSTVSDEKKSPLKAKREEELELDGTELKPAGFIQVACMFPDGQEKESQQFFSKLRDVAEKSKSRLKLNMVFVNAWNSENMNPAAWVKSAKLSGADILFVLAFKKDLEHFKNLPNDPTGKNVKVRVVAVENFAMRALYADILIELERGR